MKHGTISLTEDDTGFIGQKIDTIPLHVDKDEPNDGHYLKQLNKYLKTGFVRNLT